MFVFTKDQRHDIRFANVTDSQLGAAVKAEPAEPENQGAKRRKRQVTAGDGEDLAARAVLALARSEQQHAGERGRGATKVNDAGAGEIQKAQFDSRKPPPHFQ